MKNKHPPYKTVKGKRLSSGDERQRERERDPFTATQLSYLQGVEKPLFFLQEDEKILLKPKGSAIIFGQLEQ